MLKNSRPFSVVVYNASLMRIHLNVGKLPTKELFLSFKMFFIQKSRYLPIISANKQPICLKMIKKD